MGTRRFMELDDQRQNNDHGMIIEGRLLKSDDRVYDLVDRYTGKPDDFPVEGEDVTRDEHWPSSVGLYGSADDKPTVPQQSLLGNWDRQYMEETMTMMIRKMAQEMVPIIAERVIREEIEKLKHADQKLM